MGRRDPIDSQRHWSGSERARNDTPVKTKSGSLSRGFSSYNDAALVLIVVTGRP